MPPSAIVPVMLGLIFLFGVPILAIVAMARVGALTRKIDGETPRLIARIFSLEKRVAQLEQSLRPATEVTEAVQAPATADASSVASVAPPVAPVAAPIAAKVSPPAP